MVALLHGPWLQELEPADRSKPEFQAALSANPDNENAKKALAEITP
jgi:hypothetical protein